MGIFDLTFGGKKKKQKKSDFEASVATYANDEAQKRRIAEAAAAREAELARLAEEERIDALRQNTKFVYQVGMMHEIVNRCTTLKEVYDTATIIELLTRLDGLDKRKFAAIAGGFVFRMVHNQPLDTADIDIFLNTSRNARQNYLPVNAENNLTDVLASWFGYEVKSNSQWALTLSAKGLPDVQLIRRSYNFRNISDVFDSFDFNFSMYAIGDSRVWAFSRQVHKDACNLDLKFRLAYDYNQRTTLPRALKYMAMAKSVDRMLINCLTATMAEQEYDEGKENSFPSNENPQIFNSRLNFMREYTLKNYSHDEYHVLEPLVGVSRMSNEREWHMDPMIVNVMVKPTHQQQGLWYDPREGRYIMDGVVMANVGEVMDVMARNGAVHHRQDMWEQAAPRVLRADDFINAAPPPQAPNFPHVEPRQQRDPAMREFRVQRQNWGWMDEAIEMRENLVARRNQVGQELPGNWENRAIQPDVQDNEDGG